MTTHQFNGEIKMLIKFKNIFIQEINSLGERSAENRLRDLFSNKLLNNKLIGILTILVVISPISLVNSSADHIEQSSIIDAEIGMALNIKLKSKTNNIAYKVDNLEFDIILNFDYTDFAIGGRIFLLKIYLDNLTDIFYTQDIFVPEYNPEYFINHFEKIVNLSLKASDYAVGNHKIITCLFIEENNILSESTIWTRDELKPFPNWLIFIIVLLVLALISTIAAIINKKKKGGGK